MTTPPHGLRDADAVRSAQHVDDVAHPSLVIATTILASSLAFIDGSVVNVGLPAIGAGFGVGADHLQWVVNAYLLPLSALLLLGGAAGDRYGQRRLLIVGTGLFALASLGCALVPTIGWLLAARFLQGASAAMLMPNSLAILGQTFSGEAKGRAVGIWAATGAAAGAFGPVLGGWLIDIGSWRLIFLINIPIAMTAIALARVYVPADQRRDQNFLDWIGATLATAGLGIATWALTESSSRGWSTVALVAFAAGCVLLLLFVLAEKRFGDKAMMPLALFGSSSFVGLTLFTVLLYGALGGMVVLVPYVLIVALGYSATQAGAALLPLPLVVAVASPVVGHFAARIGLRRLLTIGPGVVAIGFLLALRIGSGNSFWVDVLPAMVVMALGLAIAVAPLTTAVLVSVDSRHTGSASGFNSAAARTGGLVATALLGSVLAVSGAALVAAFDFAMVIGAAVCVAASASARLIESQPSSRP
ncbi:DHA2 family efflux MFS transporter permease subunit [Bradyrhizobium sp. dw_411]|uniref:DHA2 family efflux MFS transporter permease subunit n=1 Tax=Bradyrhizobium sp. dw_411 TaxID=2720082 RepID=UPI001BD10156|nr:DHA2 family efflux MFS transporter permease subunit [Bradyrhizobium sp. dw_411]